MVCVGSDAPRRTRGGIYVGRTARTISQTLMRTASLDRSRCEVRVQSVTRTSRLSPMSAAPPVRAAAGWTPGPGTHETRIARAAVADLRQRGGQVGVRQTHPGTQCGARRDHARHPLQLHRPIHWLRGAVISVCSALGTPLAPQLDLSSRWIAVGPADEIWYWPTCWPAMLGEMGAGEGRAGVAAHPQVADVSAPHLPDGKLRSKGYAHCTKLGVTDRAKTSTRLCPLRRASRPRATQFERSIRRRVAAHWRQAAARCSEQRVQLKSP